MKLRGRSLVVLSIVAFITHLAPYGRAADDAHLAVDVSATSPANGEDLLLDSIVGFEPGSGEAVIDPGTTMEEIVSYNGIGTDPFRLFGVTRTNPVDHAKDAVVRPSAAPEATPTPTQTGAEATTVAPTDVPPAPSEAESASPLPDRSADTDSNATEGSSSSSDPSEDAGATVGPDVECLITCLPPQCTNLPSTGVTTAWVIDCVNALAEIDLVCNSYDSCRAYLTERLCPLSGVFCNIPPAAPQVVVRVEFDDVIGLPGPSTAGCGYAGFTAYTATGSPASQNQAYTATATTVPTLAAPTTYKGNLDGSGRAVLYYCPPPGVVTSPVEVTFTATVGGATGVADRAWSPGELIDPTEASCVASPVVANGSGADGGLGEEVCTPWVPTDPVQAERASLAALGLLGGCLDMPDGTGRRKIVRVYYQYYAYSACPVPMRQGYDIGGRGYGMTHIEARHGAWTQFRDDLTSDAIGHPSASTVPADGRNSSPTNRVFCLFYNRDNQDRTWRVVVEYGKDFQGIITAYYRLGHSC